MANPTERPNVADMTDRELLEEIVLSCRQAADAVAALENHPMIAAIANGQNPMMALLGRG
jgi:hypothetical protein